MPPHFRVGGGKDMIVPPPLSDSDAVASDLIFEIDLQVGPVCIKPLPTNSTAFNLL